MIPGLSSFNNDILNAQPDSLEDKEKLVEEIKFRAKGMVSSKNYPEAIRLYTKGIEVSTHSPNTSSILYANRSMCHLNVGNSSAAIEDAKSSISLDPDYLKGYYRLAMAQIKVKKYFDAKESLQNGLKLKPDDSEFNKQLEKVNQYIKEAKQEVTSKPASYNSMTDAIKSSTTPTSTTTVPSSSNSASKTKPTASSTKGKDNDEEDEDIDAVNLRGYKKTADGKVTTYFNRELDEKTKSLIGDIAPKKIEPSVAHVATAPPEKLNGSSVWNAAGTFEERTLTPWAKDTLTELFSSLLLPLNAGVYKELNHINKELSDITKVEFSLPRMNSVSGDAQVTLSRGKKKHICDFEIEAAWKLQCDFSASSSMDSFAIEGKVMILDITSDKEYELGAFEAQKFNSKEMRVNEMPSYASVIYTLTFKNSRIFGVIQKALEEKIDTFCKELKQK